MSTSHISVPPHTTVSEYMTLLQYACEAGKSCSLHFTDRIKRVSDLLKVTWEICEQQGIKPKALQFYFTSDCILVPYNTTNTNGLK